MITSDFRMNVLFFKAHSKKLYDPVSKFRDVYYDA